MNFLRTLNKLAVGGEESIFASANNSLSLLFSVFLLNATNDLQKVALRRALSTKTQNKIFQKKKKIKYGGKEGACRLRDTTRYNSGPVVCSRFHKKTKKQLSKK